MNNLLFINDDKKFIIIKRPIFVYYNQEKMDEIFSKLIPYLKNEYKCFYGENGEPATLEYIRNLKSISDLLIYNGIDTNQFVILYENSTESYINYLKKLGFEYEICINWIFGATPESFIKNKYLEENLDKKFLFLNRIPKHHRVELFNFCKTEGILDNCFYSAKWRNENNFEEDYESEKVRLRVDIHDHLIKIYNQSYIHIVTETKCEDDIENIDVSFFSEKTFRHIAFNRPFILVSQKNSLKKLKQYGFKTFSPFIDESYDELNYKDRIKKIKDIIYELNKKTNKELFEICKSCETIIEHNRKRLFELAEEMQNNIEKKYPESYLKLKELFLNYQIYHG